MNDVETFVEQLKAGDPSARLAAAERLAGLGEDAASAAAALVEACGDDDLRDACVGALEELGPPPVEQLAELATLLATQNESTAYWAATLLGRAGADAAPHSDRIAVVASDGAKPVAERAVWALGKIGPGASTALPTLRTLAEAEEPRTARLAQQAIAAIEG